MDRSVQVERHFFVPRGDLTTPKLTEAFVRTLLVPEGAKDGQAFDNGCPGFGVRKQASGQVSYSVKGSLGKQQRPKRLARHSRPYPQGSKARKDGTLVPTESILPVNLGTRGLSAMRKM